MIPRDSGNSNKPARTVRRKPARKAYRPPAAVSERTSGPVRRPAGPVSERAQSTPHEARKVERFKKTKTYKRAARAGYAAAPVERRKLIVKRAKTHPSVEGRVATQEHKKRVEDPGHKRRVAAQKVRRRALAQERAYASQGKQLKVESTRQKARVKKEPSIAGIPMPSIPVGAVVKNELEGKGALAALTGVIGERAAKGYGSQNLIKTSAGKLGERAVKDIANLPSAAVPSVYVPVAGVVEASKGRPARLKQLGRDINESDPVYNLAAAGVEAATGDTKSAKKRLSRAGKAASEHPGFAAMEVLGAKAAVGRGAGRAARAGALGKPAKKAAATARAPKRLEGTALEVQRSYSPDVITKGRQVAVEKAKRRKAEKIIREAQRAEKTDPEAAAALRHKAQRVHPDAVKVREVQRRVDETVAANEDIRRIHRAKTLREVDRLMKPVHRKDRGAVALVAQNITKASKEDLKAYARELEGEAQNLGPAELRASRELRRHIQTVLENKKANLGEIEVAARKYAETTRAGQKKLVKAGMIAEAQSERAALVPYAVRRMGGRRLAKEELQGVVDTATKSRHEARLELGRAAREREKAVAQAGTAKGRAAVLSRNVGGRRAENLAEKVREPKYVAGGHGVAESSKALAKAEARFAAAKERVKAADAEVAAARDFRRSGGGLVDAAGKPLTNDRISAHMKAHNVSEPAFISQKPGMRGGQNFFVSSGRAPGLSTRTRTGEATRKGTFDVHPDVLREQAARTQGLVDAAEGWDRIVGENVLRNERNRPRAFASRVQAENIARDLSASGEREWKVIQLSPWGAHKEQLRTLLDRAEQDVVAGVGHEKNPIIDAMQQAVEAKGGEGPFGIVPAEAAGRLSEHLNKMDAGPLGKVGQVVNQQFRRTVLATSTSWAAGNVIEAAMRGALHRAGPRSYITGKRTLKAAERLDPAKAEELAVRAASGGHFSTAERQFIKRNAEQFAGTWVEPMANGLAKFWRTPGPKHAAIAWNAWTHGVFTGMRRLEGEFQTAVLGAELRRSPLMDGQLLKTSKAAAEQAARGAVDRNTAVTLGRAVDRAYGRYGKYSPTTKNLIAHYTPFLAWSLNAVKFVVDVLPRDHPIALGLLASAENATAEWRKDKGLDLFVEGSVPDFLQGSIPTKGGGHVRASRFTPFGAFGDIGETLGGNVLPQYSGPLMALKGLDWKGDPIKVPEGTPEGKAQAIKALVAAGTFIDATIPIVAQAKRVEALGPKAFNPMRPVPPSKSKAKAAKWKPSSTRRSVSKPSSGGISITPPSNDSRSAGGGGAGINITPPSSSSGGSSGGAINITPP